MSQTPRRAYCHSTHVKPSPIVTTPRHPDNAICEKKYHTTRLHCCAGHSEWIWTRPKRYALHADMEVSVKKNAKVSPLSHNTIFHTLSNTQACHHMPRLPRKNDITTFFAKPSQMRRSAIPKITALPHCHHLTQPCHKIAKTYTTLHVSSAAPATRNEYEHLRNAAVVTGRRKLSCQNLAAVLRLPHPKYW